MPSPPIPSREDVEAGLRKALAAFLDADRYLLGVHASERAVGHRLAWHLQREFSEWHVDCEYNRDGGAIKSIDVPQDLIAWNETEAKTVFPDIIVHWRGEEGPNVLVIEMKKVGSPGSNFDRRKLWAFRQDLGYHCAAFVRSRTGTEQIFSNPCGRTK